MIKLSLKQICQLILITILGWNCCSYNIYTYGVTLPLNLHNVIDFHVHSSPDITERSLDDFELAQMAAKAGMKAIVLKNHFTPTADRAILVNKIVPNIQLFGGVVLNKSVGGLNPDAVEVMYKIGKGKGKIVWFPTVDADYHRKIFHQEGEGIKLIKKGNLLPEVEEILKLIAQYNLILGTGHISPEEVKLVTKKAISLGVKYILITHAMADVPGLSLEDMQEIADLGAFLELTYVNHLMGENATIISHQNWHQVSIHQMAEAIKIIGAKHFVLSTDLGQKLDPFPVTGYNSFIKGLINENIPIEDINLMSKNNPAKLLEINNE